MTVRRRLFVEGEADTKDEPLMLFPEDRASAQAVDAHAALHVTFADRFPGMALDLEEDGLSFEGGSVSGTLTATQLPLLAVPVPLEGQTPLASVWRIGPVGARAAKPLAVALPNQTGIPAGRLAAIATYDPQRHMIVRSALARVSGDGKEIRSLGPVEAASIEYLGVIALTDEQVVLLERVLSGDDAARGVAPSPEPTPAVPLPDDWGTTGALESRPDPGQGLLGRFGWLLVGRANAQVRDQICSTPLNPWSCSLDKQYALCTGGTKEACYSWTGLIDALGTADNWVLQFGMPMVNGRVRTTYMAQTGGEPLAVFRNWIVRTRTSVTQTAGLSGEDGKFSIPTRLSSPRYEDAWVYTLVDTGPRYTAVKETEGGITRTRFMSSNNSYMISTTAYNKVYVAAFHQSDLVVDLRMLEGELTFKDRDDVPIPTGATRWSKKGELESISPDDLAQTEVYFFRKDDNYKAPIARYAVAVPCGVVDRACAEGSQAWYFRLRLGPSDPLQKRKLSYCDYWKAHSSELTGEQLAFCQMECKTPRVSQERLKGGDELVVFALNHATGFAGIAHVKVPRSTSSGSGGAGDCNPGDKKTFNDHGVAYSYTSCDEKHLKIVGNVTLYPPEVGIEVSRKAPKDDGYKTARSRREHLVRSGGAAVTGDDYVKVRTVWRVRKEKQRPDAPAPGLNPGAKSDPAWGPGGAGRSTALSSGVDPTLEEVPAGVPPLAGHVIRVIGTAVEQPFAQVFRVEPGPSTVNLQLSTNEAKQGAPELLPVGLPLGTYYVHVVGHSLLVNDANQNAQTEREELEEIMPEGPPDLVNVSPDGPTNFPVKAIQLTNAYDGQEADGTIARRFDLGREHQFRIMEIRKGSVTANAGTSASRRVDVTTTTQPADTAAAGDLSYQLLGYLLNPVSDSSRGAGVGTFQAWNGNDQAGTTCTVRVSAVGESSPFTIECANDLQAIIKALDVVYIELYLYGNAENVLYRYAIKTNSPGVRIKGYTVEGNKYDGFVVKRGYPQSGDPADPPGERVRVEAEIGEGQDPHEVKWDVKLEDAAAGGKIVGVDPEDGRGLAYSFIVKPPAHRPYKQGTNGCGKYASSPTCWPATICGNGCKDASERFTVTVKAVQRDAQDERKNSQSQKEIIIQEYWNHRHGNTQVGVPCRPGQTSGCVGEIVPFQKSSTHIVNIQGTSYKQFQLGDIGALGDEVWDEFVKTGSDSYVDYVDPADGTKKAATPDSNLKLAKDTPIIRGPHDIYWPPEGSTPTPIHPWTVVPATWLRSFAPMTPPNHGCLPKGPGDCDDELKQDCVLTGENGQQETVSCITPGTNGKPETLVLPIYWALDLPRPPDEATGGVFGVQQLWISSGWRNPERNEAVGGVETSMHQIGLAADVKMRRVTAPPELQQEPQWLQVRPLETLRCMLMTAGWHVVNNHCVPQVPLHNDQNCRWNVIAEYGTDFSKCNTRKVSHIHVNR